MTRLSAAADGQPRHQQRPPTTASHRTIARRPPTPSAAHRARRQRRRKASSHIYIHRNTFAPTTLPASSSRAEHVLTSYHYLQQHLYKRSLRGSALLHHEHGIQTQERLSIRTSCINKILARGQRFSRNNKGTLSVNRTFGEFKGCQWHSSKGGS